MKQINLWAFILLTWMWTGCKEDSFSLPGDGTGKAGEGHDGVCDSGYGCIRDSCNG